MKAITVSEAKLLDEKAREVYGLSTLVLMENAGRGVAEEIIKLKKRKIAIFCGKGNNGGDGFVAARHLRAKGIRSDVLKKRTVLNGKNFKQKKLHTDRADNCRNNRRYNICCDGLACAGRHDS